MKHLLCELWSTSIRIKEAPKIGELGEEWSWNAFDWRSEVNPYTVYQCKEQSTPQALEENRR